MEYIIAQCSELFLSNRPILFSVMAAGLLGSLSHCSVMCSPMVTAQMLQLNTQKKSQWHMVLYHAGRISTYGLLGVAVVLFGQWAFSGNLSEVAHIMMVLAGITFLLSAILPHKTHQCCSEKIQNVTHYFDKLPIAELAIYIRGMLMGFTPCGMMLAVLLLVATFTSPFQAGITMLFFGLTTIPILQITGYGALSLAKRHPYIISKAGKGIMVLNGIFLCAIGLNIVSIS